MNAADFTVLLHEPSVEFVDLVAKTIFLHEGGLDPKQWETFTGKAKKAWKTEAPWDTDPNELCEHERDEYRTQALMVIEVVKDTLMKGTSDGNATKTSETA